MRVSASQSRNAQAILAGATANFSTQLRSVVQPPSDELAAGSEHQGNTVAEADAFPDRVLQDGVINAQALQNFCTGLAAALRMVPADAAADDLQQLAARIADLPQAIEEKVTTRQKSKPDKPTPWWEATLDLRDLSDGIRKSAKKAARAAPSGSAEAEALEGVEAMFLGLKRVALTQQARPRFAALGEEAAERFTAMFPGSRDLRPGQLYDAQTLFEIRAGAGVTAPIDVLMGGAGRLGVRHTIGTTLTMNDDSNLFTERQLGFGAALHLDAGLLPWLKVLTGSFTGNFTRIKGRFSRDPDPAVAFRSMIKETTETNARGLTGKYIARSASPLNRWWDNVNQARKRASIWKIRGVHFNYPSNVPAWATEAKIAKGLSVLPLHRAGEAIGRAAGPATGQALQDLMRKHFPSEAQVQEVLAQHLDSPEAIRRLRNSNNDPSPSRMIAASNAQLERGPAIVQTSFAGSGTVTASPLALVNGTATGDVDHLSRTISMQKGEAQNTLVNTAMTQDPAQSLAAFGTLWRSYGAAADRFGHPALHLAEVLHAPPLVSPRNNVEHDQAFADRFLGPRAAMSPHHAKVYAVLKAGVDPAAVMTQIDRRLRRLVSIYQSFRNDADEVVGGDAARAAAAASRINANIFGGGYDLDDDDKAHRNFLADAQSSCTLALAETDLTITMVKTFMAASSRMRPEWTKQSDATDLAYRSATEIMSDPSLPAHLETIHRRQALMSSSTLRQRLTSGKIALNANLLDVPHYLSTIPGIGTYLAMIPLLPQPAKFEASLNVSHDFRKSHYDPEQAGTYDTAQVTLAGPPPSGILVRLGEFARDQLKGGDSAQEDDLKRLRSDLKLALKATSPQDLLGNDVSGLRYEWRRHTPPKTDGRKLAPETAYTRWSHVMTNDQELKTPNIFAYIPHAHLAVLDGLVSPTTVSTRTLVERIGSDQGYVQKRMASDIGKLFVADAEGKLDMAATAKAFQADRFRREALFGSHDVPILSVLYQIASLDSRNLDQPYTNIKGETTEYANPTVQYLKQDRQRLLRFGGVAASLAAGSGEDPNDVKMGAAPIMGMLRDAKARRRADPALLEEMQTLYRQAQSWTADETLDFFTRTPKGRYYLNWFHGVARAKQSSIGDMKGDPAYGPQVNHDLFRVMPVVKDDHDSFLPRVTAEAGPG